ncbi:MAG TPA: hypothetical protein VIW26_05730 [Gemmatimonadales bacterium]|jgi:hypothetical protein
MTVPLIDRAQLEPTERESLGRAIAAQTTLERALDWARALTPPRGVESVLTQDEYTHDVLIPYGTRYLVYDTS